MVLDAKSCVNVKIKQLVITLQACAHVVMGGLELIVIHVSIHKPQALFPQIQIYYESFGYHFSLLK